MTVCVGADIDLKKKIGFTSDQLLISPTSDNVNIISYLLIRDAMQLNTSA